MVVIVDLQFLISCKVVGTLTLSGGITFSDGTTQTSAGASTGFSIAMALHLDNINITKEN